MLHYYVVISHVIVPIFFSRNFYRLENLIARCRPITQPITFVKLKYALSSSSTVFIDQQHRNIGLKFHLTILILSTISFFFFSSFFCLFSSSSSTISLHYDIRWHCTAFALSSSIVSAVCCRLFHLILADNLLLLLLHHRKALIARSALVGVLLL